MEASSLFPLGRCQHALGPDLGREGAQPRGDRCHHRGPPAEPADERHVVDERARRQENVYVGLVGNLVVGHHRYNTHTKAARGANRTIGR
jgi:hypothetical protein